MYAGTHIGKYEIRSKIGEGGMGEVYSALDRELERNVAIKLLPSEFTNDNERKTRFRHEARAVSALNHPNILTIYDIGESDEGCYLATELVEGKTLRELLKDGQLPLGRVLKIVEQAANALTAAHHAQIVHRDIKPENIMVRKDMIVKVLDFGLAKSKLPAEDNSSDNKTLPGTVMGSARYMSPEQARGHEVDERTDIWSLGVVLYEMLMGKAPFSGETTADTIAAVVYKEPAPLTDVLPNVSPELNRIVRKALQKDRDERYQNIKDLALDLKELAHEVEHSNSGNRALNITSSPDFNENPTIIHRSVSQGHIAAKTGSFTASFPKWQGQSPLRKTLTLVAAVFLVALVGVGIYAMFGTSKQMADHAFFRPQISRINTDGRIQTPAISPDGKYLAYISGEPGSRSLINRQIATDSTITLVQPTDLNIQSVVFSPSGDHVYYTVTSTDFAVNSLYQVPTLGGTSKLLIEDVDSPITMAPDGKSFAFIRHVPKTNEDVICIADIETLEIRELAKTSDSDYDLLVFRLAWSPDGKKIITGAGKRQSGFVTGTDIVEVDMSGNLKPLNRREFFTATNFAWLSDGSGYLFTGRMSQNDPVQIWLAPYPDGPLHQVTNDLNDYADLGISSDGKNIVTIKGDVTGSIVRYASAESSAVQLMSDSRNVEGKNGILQLADGRLVFTRHEGKEADLWISDADGKNGKVLFKQNGYSVDPVATNDGKYIVFNLQKDKRSRIWRVNIDGTGATALTEDNDGDADFSPQVTADGKTVIFQRQMAGEDRYKLMKVSIDGGAAQVFYEDEGRGVFNPKLSKDGTRIAFASYDIANFTKQMHIATLNGSEFGKIERDLEYNLINAFQWAPDSKSLTLLSTRGGAQNLWRQPINGSEAEQITTFKSGRIFNYQWGSNGKDLLIARGSVSNDLILMREADVSRQQDAAQIRRYDVRNRSLLGDLLYSVRG